MGSLPKVQGSVDPRFAAGLPFLVPEILEFEALCNSGKIPAFSSFPKFSQSFSAKPTGV